MRHDLGLNKIENTGATAGVDRQLGKCDMQKYIDEVDHAAHNSKT